jgi:hypothetical protein
MGFFSADYIVGDTCLAVVNANLYHFGLLTSAFHMAWMRQVCGRLESRYRYSNNIVYNNFPWPQNPTPKQVQKVMECAQNMLDIRKLYPDSTLADLYDPVSMPKPLLKAHLRLDKAVDQCYRKYTFPTELSRLQFLFELYRQYTEPLLKEVKPQKSVRRTRKG